MLVTWSLSVKESLTLQWRHNGCDSVSNHQSHDCLLNRLFRRRSKKTSKLRITGLCVRGIYRGPVNFPHKWPVTRKMCPFDDIIMSWRILNHLALFINCLFFQNQAKQYTFDIIFVFDRCQHNLTAVMLVKFSCNSKDTLNRIRSILNEKQQLKL